jgi:hypothetical protein
VPGTRVTGRMATVCGSASVNSMIGGETEAYCFSETRSLGREFESADHATFVCLPCTWSKRGGTPAYCNISGLKLDIKVSCMRCGRIPRMAAARVIWRSCQTDGSLDGARDRPLCEWTKLPSMLPVSLHLKIACPHDERRKERGQRAKDNSPATRRGRHPTAPAEKLELEAPKDHATSDPSNLFSFLLNYIQTCT